MQNKGIININNHDLYYEWINLELKTRDRSILIFLHEGLGSIKQWKSFPKELCELMQLPGLVYDRYGYGNSEIRSFPWPIHFLEIEARSVLPAIIGKFEIEKHIVFGHSDGGTIGLFYASLKPKNLLGSIIEAPHVVIENISADGIRGVVEASSDPRFVKSLSRYHGERTEELIKSWTGVWLSEEGGCWEMCNQLSSIESPVLFMQGENDNFGSELQLREVENRTLGSFHGIIVPKCGHVPHLEVGGFVLKQSAYFIEEIK